MAEGEEEVRARGGRRVDLRVLRTRRSIQEALIRLMRDAPLGKLSVRQICDEALVNKGTFYRHYQDKYDLAAQTARELLDEMRELTGTRLASRIRPLVEDEVRPPTEESDRELTNVVGRLLLLRDVEVDGTTVRDLVREHIENLLRPYAERGLVTVDVETEAWVLTMLLFEYPAYARGVRNPLRPVDYVRSVQEIVDLYERVFFNED